MLFLQRRSRAFVFLFFIISCFNTVYLAAMQGRNGLLNMAGHIVRGAGQVVDATGRQLASASGTAAACAAERDVLRGRLERGEITQQNYDDRIIQIARREGNARIEENLLNGVIGFYSQAAQTALEVTKAEATAASQQKIETAKMAAKTDAEQRGALQRLQHLTNPETLKNIALASVGVCGAVILSYYGSKVAYNYVMTKIGVPTLIRESSVKNYKDRAYDFMFGEAEAHNQQITSSDLVLNNYLDTQVRAIALDMRSNHETGLPHKNLLLYGPPGTGKTTIAKILAREAGMDYAIMSGADFAQFSEGRDVEQLHALFDWAAASERGLVIFIDEIDAFARDRSVASQRAVNLLNAFLSRTGELATKFMIVGATNHRSSLDSAFLSRMHKRLEIPLPTAQERLMLVKTYLNKYILQDRRLLRTGDDEREISLSLSDDISEDFLQQASQDLYMANFSGRDIAFMIDEMRAACYRRKEYVLSRALFAQILHDKRVQVHGISADKFSTQELLDVKADLDTEFLTDTVTS